MPANRGGPWHPKISANVLAGNAYDFSNDDTLDEGATRRGEYAKAAMQGLLALGWSGEQRDVRLAMRAFEIADAMIAYEDST